MPLLVLDSGGAFLKHPEDAGNTPLLERTGAAMVEALGAVGTDALNVGGSDLLLPPELLAGLVSRARFPVLSANVVDAAGRAPFRGWVVREVGGQRIGIFGVSGEPQAAVPAGRAALRTSDPAAAARRAVAELRGTCRLVVALSQLGLQGDEKLAREVPGIDVILGGFSRATTLPPRVVGSTIIVHAGAKGMRVGRLELEVEPGTGDGEPWTALAAAGSRSGRRYAWSVEPLDARLPDDPALAALLDRHRQELRALQLVPQETVGPAIVAAPSPTRRPYVGAAACARCHPEQHREWSASPHARAFAALERKHQDLNPECVPCHVTAHGDPGGYVRGGADGVDLRNVQCEACHGFGRDHAGKGRIRGRVPETICRRCHTTENSPTFRYEPYLKQLGRHAARHFSRAADPAPTGAPRAR